MTVQKHPIKNIDQLRLAYDAEVRAFLANKGILAMIMEECVEEFANCPLSDIAEKYITGKPQIFEVGVDKDTTNPTAAHFSQNIPPNVPEISNEDTSETEGTVRYDIRFLAKAPKEDGFVELIINLEAQRNYFPGYPIVTRGVYYASRMISAQKGVEFSGNHYEEIKKVYSIWVCYDPPKNRENTIVSYHMKEDFLVKGKKTKIEPRNHYDLLSVIIIGLGDPDEALSSRTLRILSTVFSNRKKREEKKNILQSELNIVYDTNTEERMNAMCDISWGIWEDGKAEGKEEGKIEGKAEGARETSLKLSLMGLSENKIAEAVGFPVKTVSEWIRSQAAAIG